jgi:hypothetical protein
LADSFIPPAEGADGAADLATYVLRPGRGHDAIRDVAVEDPHGDRLYALVWGGPLYRRRASFLDGSGLGLLEVWRHDPSLWYFGLREGGVFIGDIRQAYEKGETQYHIGIVAQPPMVIRLSAFQNVTLSMLVRKEFVLEDDEGVIARMGSGWSCWHVELVTERSHARILAALSVIFFA